jgi:hypothetical protein
MNADGVLVALIEMHSVVALLEDLPDEGLSRGQVGVIVGDWALGFMRSSSVMTTVKPTPWLR